VAGGPDADEALAALGTLESYPDLIVADLRLAAGNTGLAAVHRLREELGVSVPALIVSADMSAAAAREVRTSGFALLPKPVVAPRARGGGGRPHRGSDLRCVTAGIRD
jgi:CheY-like chemotaxis protein